MMELNENVHQQKVDETDSSEFSDNDMEFIDLSSCDIQEEDDDEDVYWFKTYTADEIFDHMIKFVREVNSVLEMSEPMTRILLSHLNWDKDKLLDKFYSGNQEILFKEANIVNPFTARPTTCTALVAQISLPPENSSLDQLEECQVCLIFLSASKLTGLQCGHRFCRSCWNHYLKVQIMEQGNSRSLTCAEHNCTILVDDVTVMKLVKEVRVRRKYQKLLINNFVDCNKLLKWCVSPGCDTVIEVQYIDNKPVTCNKCYLTFCFGCLRKWHEPLSCELLRHWEAKSNDDTETTNWIITHTKECPRCHTSIEKNGGCNHMTCRKCDIAFCWLCLKPWSSHTALVGCNVFDRVKRQRQELETFQIRSNLERYLFYSNRYTNHLASFRLENTLYAKVQKQMEKNVKQHMMSWVEVQFLRKAVSTLISCRQTLMFTYALAYYLEKNNQTEIFEANQQDLEHSVELLSGYLERDLINAKLGDIKDKIQDKYIYCESRRRALVKHVQEGRENDWWRLQYNTSS